MSNGQAPILRPQEVVRVLERLGYRRIRKSGSGNLRFGHPDGRETTVPMQKGKTIGRGLSARFCGT